jgi:hypothetical protein
VLFEADEVLDAIDFRRKKAIELAINWPYVLDQKCALKLLIRDASCGVKLGGSRS